MTDNEIKRRLDKIEDSLTPAQVVLVALEKAATGSPGEYLLADPSRIRSALARKFKKKTPENLIKMQRDLVDRAFLGCLALGANGHVAEVLERNLEALAVLAENNERMLDRLQARPAILDSARALTIEPYPLAPDDAAAIKAAADHQVRTWETFAAGDLPQWLQANATVKPASSLRALKKAARALVRAGEVVGGAAVEIGAVPFESLLLAPLVDGVWIDAHVVELAEFGALLENEGFELRVCDGHSLAPLQICFPEKVLRPGEVEPPGVDRVITELRQMTRAALAKFSGRSKEIGGRNYFHIHDYRAWPSRRVQGDLRTLKGVVVKSWNSWVDRQGGEGKVELAGTKVRKLAGLLDRWDFIVCSDEQEFNLRRQERKARLAKLRATLSEEATAALKNRNGILEPLKELFETYFAIAIIAERHFEGNAFLPKEKDDKLREQITEAQTLAKLYNQLLDLSNPLSPSVGAGSQSFPSRIDVAAVKQAAKHSAKGIVDNLVRDARSQTPRCS